MNTMEDKELQELFAAKRTVEANRRRQEALRQLIETRAAKEVTPAPRKVLRLWPVWACAAAAAIALLLIMLPALFNQEDPEPLLVAETEVPEVALPQTVPVEEGENDTPCASSYFRIARESRIARTANPSEAAPAAQTVAEDAPIIEPVIETPVLEKPIMEEPVMEVLETVAPTPRVMRRQSTLIACTDGCTAPEGTGETSSRNVQINLFNNENYADATIHTFVISK